MNEFFWFFFGIYFPHESSLKQHFLKNIFSTKTGSECSSTFTIEIFFIFLGASCIIKLSYSIDYNINKLKLFVIDLSY